MRGLRRGVRSRLVRLLSRGDDEGALWSRRPAPRRGAEQHEARGGPRRESRASGCHSRLSPLPYFRGPQFGTRSKGAMKGDLSKAYHSSNSLGRAATLACTTTYAAGKPSVSIPLARSNFWAAKRIGLMKEACDGSGRALDWFSIGSTHSMKMPRLRFGSGFTRART